MGGFDMEVLYEYACANETELRMEEQRCIDKMKPILNSQRAYSSEEDTIEYHKQYREQNRDMILEYNKKRYEQNRDAIIEKQKKYNEQKKAVINKKTTCECGCVVAKRHLNKHKQTNKHIKLMEKVI